MISAWKHYDNNLSKYETSYPPAFPWNREQREDSPHYEKGADGYWYDPAAKETGKRLGFHYHEADDRGVTTYLEMMRRR